jgi:Flp pilus assembly pilin Flp
LGSERGVTAVEYALILALIGLAIVAAVKSAGIAAKKPFEDIATELAN